MSDPFFQFAQRLTLCMLKYQYIEYALKSCLLRFHAAVRFRLDGYLPYEVPLDAIENAAMGQLVKWFKSYSANQPLLTALNKVKSERDHVAHQGFMFTLEKEANDTVILERLKELEASHQRAEDCLAMLFSEVEKAEDVVQKAYADLRARSESEGGVPPEALHLPPTRRPPEGEP